MSEQLRLGGPGAISRARVQSSVDCGSAATLRVELHLDERPDGRDVETVRITEMGRVTVLPIDQLEQLLRALSRARDVSESRKARRSGT